MFAVAFHNDRQGGVELPKKGAEELKPGSRVNEIIFYFYVGSSLLLTKKKKKKNNIPSAVGLYCFSSVLVFFRLLLLKFSTSPLTGLSPILEDF